jgi:hypothetical protein
MKEYPQYSGSLSPVRGKSNDLWRGRGMSRHGLERKTARRDGTLYVSGVPTETVPLSVYNLGKRYVTASNEIGKKIET